MSIEKMIPYQNLYVYEISGEISDSKAFFKEDFIGCWNEGEILILLDPCVVFGTGYHPTTRSCLKALWNLYQKEKPETVLDLGTGTGILAVAAVKWGARRVLTVDCNELAAETASRNAKLNGEMERIEVKKGRAEEAIREDADLVCANLHYQVIEGLIHQTPFLIKEESNSLRQQWTYC